MSVIRNVVDSMISQASPATNYVSAQTFTLRNVTNKRLAELMKLAGLPAGADVVIDSAFLTFFAAETMPSTTVQAKGNTSDWTPGTVKWSKAPTSGAVIGSVTKSAVNGTPFDINVLPLVAAWAAGGKNYGLRLETTSTAAAGRKFHSADAAGANAKYKPYLTITWSAKPSTPDGFVATGGGQVSIPLPTLPWRYADPAGLPMAAYEFQSNSTNVWTAPSYSSGEKLSSVPQHTLTTPLADAEALWYRARHKNSANKWSDWSPGQLTGRTVKPGLAISAPVEGGSVGGYTPTYAWALAAGLQTGFQLDTFNAVSGVELDTSGDRPGTDNDYETSRLALQTGQSAMGRLRVRDDVDRVATPGDPVYIEATVTFSIEPSGAIAQVEDLAVAAASDRPFPKVSWTRSTSTDSYLGERRVCREDDDTFGPWVPFELALGDVAEGGNSYAWYDVTAPPRHRLQYRVRPVQDGNMGEADDVAEITMRPMYIWLLDPDDHTWVLPLAGQDPGGWDMGEQSAMLELRGNDRLILVHEGFRGYEGTISGSFEDELPDIGGATAQELRDRVWRTKLEPLKTWRLLLSDMNIPVSVRKVVPSPTPDVDLTWVASFEFYQQGELPWS